MASPLSLCCLAQLLHAAPFREPCKALGQSLRGWPARDSAWNLLIRATEPQICHTTLLEEGEEVATVPLSTNAQLRGLSLCCGNGPWEVLGSGLNSLTLVSEEDLKEI